MQKLDFQLYEKEVLTKQAAPPPKILLLQVHCSKLRCQV